jgi:hypothetical protein
VGGSSLGARVFSTLEGDVQILHYFQSRVGYSFSPFHTIELENFFTKEDFSNYTLSFIYTPFPINTFQVYYRAGLSSNREFLYTPMYLVGGIGARYKLSTNFTVDCCVSAIAVLLNVSVNLGISYSFGARTYSPSS